jgi:hypothetical protein
MLEDGSGWGCCWGCWGTEKPRKPHFGFRGRSVRTLYTSGFRRNRAGFWLACKAGALDQTELFARGAKLPTSNLLGQSTFATTPRKEPDTVGSPHST